ncbi:DNA-methyltransferase [Sphingomonas sp. SRS2]|uniref:DNA-methyltransferase n=1 Tax=Sphingomonas sp. SRS2 TaxID=133190 RepID=UPI0006982985|nr:DNA methyltransferase [Sphingomonas sp. SRS2]
MRRPADNKVIRCAVYTRKSDEKGLEQEFNSLDAQREACDAYIASQRHEGWKLVRDAYDDGGLSGGNMDRPALKMLLADIKAGKVRHREFVMGSGEMSDGEFESFLRAAFQQLINFSVDGSMHFSCMDWRGLGIMLKAGEVYSELKNICCWVKSQGGMGSLYRSQHELVAVFKAGTAPHINNIELGKHGRNRSNVWMMPGMNSFQKGRAEQLAMHPTVKPVALVADAMLDCSKRGGLVLDVFAGSGTTLVAAERTGRLGAAMELDPHYADVTLRRFCDVTGIEPVNAWTGHIIRRRTDNGEAK